jgi:hypothetical protein
VCTWFIYLRTESNGVPFGQDNEHLISIRRYIQKFLDLADYEKTATINTR